MALQRAIDTLRQQLVRSDAHSDELRTERDQARSEAQEARLEADEAERRPEGERARADRAEQATDQARQRVREAESPISELRQASIDRGHGLIRRWTATNAGAHDGPRLADLIDKENTARSSYRSAKNEALLRQRHLVSRIHRKKPRGRPMAPCPRQANARKSAVRSSVEHVFAYQKGPGLLIGTIVWRGRG
jgi:hypothetical protein